MAEGAQTRPGAAGQSSMGGDPGRSTSDQAQEKAKEVAGQAQEKAGRAVDQARGKVREQVDQRSTQLGEQVSSNAGDVRAIAEELRKQGKDRPARMADQAADRAERVGSWLTESDGDRILRDVEDFGRRRPWAVAGCGLAVGFVASRMLKASSGQRYRGTQRPSPADRPTRQLPSNSRETVPAPATEGVTVGAGATTGNTGVERGEV